MNTLISPSYGPPSAYEIRTVPKPNTTRQDEVLVKVFAASINPVDVKGAAGMMRMVSKVDLPYRLGYDFSGVVIGVGEDVPPHLKPGTEVYGIVADNYRGAIGEYCIAPCGGVALKPAELSHVDAASIPVASLTAFQALQRADKALAGGLKGKTVFVPGGLSGVGAAAVQLAKRIFQAGRVITTLSTSKIPRVEELLGANVVDKIVDYTKEDLHQAITHGTVDFMVDTMNSGLTSLPLMKSGGVIISVSGIPFGEDLRRAAPGLSAWMYKSLDVYGSYMGWRASRANVNYESLMVDQKARDLNALRGWIEQGLFRPLVGCSARMDDIDSVREKCTQVHSGKGSIGKFVVEVQ